MVATVEPAPVTVVLEPVNVVELANVAEPPLCTVNVLPVAMEKVAPTARVTDLVETDRTDEVRPSLPREDALRNAPDALPAAGLFRVPRVLG